MATDNVHPTVRALLAETTAVQGPSRKVRSQPFYQAVLGRNTSETKRFLESGADVNWHGGSGSRAFALHVAAWAGDLPLAELLLSYGADVRKHGGDRWTALHSTAMGVLGASYVEEDKAAIAALLIDRGADVNALSDDVKRLDGGGTDSGVTPLGLARAWNHHQIEALLLRHGAADKYDVVAL